MTQSHYTRRQLLTGGLGAALAVGMACSRLLSPAMSDLVTRAAATSAASGTGDIGAIEHVVFLMHENRSFDHYFGMLGVSGEGGVHGFGDSSSAFAQAWPGGSSSTLLPFHMDTTAGIAECTDDLDHSWPKQHDCWNNGAMDSFVATHVAKEGPDLGPLTMGYYTEADIPFYYALAQAFTICDNYYCSVLGPTHPNRLLQMSGTLDPAGVAGGPILDTNSQNSLEFTCSWPTMPEILENAGVSWKVYNPYGGNYVPGPDNLSMALCKNVLMYFNQYSATSSDLYQKAFGYCGPNVPKSNPGFTGVGGFGTPFSTKGPDDLKADIKAGTLPAVSWIVPPVGYDEHPPAPAALGEWYTAQVLKTLMSNTDIWRSTVLFIMYDENDGFFDHMPPPTAPDGTAGEYVTAAGYPDSNQLGAGPIGMGIRVPMLVVSPFSQGGWVCSDVFDHTSQLQFLGAWGQAHGYDIDPTVSGNLSAWRQATAGDLTATLASGPTTNGTRVIWPAKPSLPKTSPSIKKAPIDAPEQCAPGDLIELGRSTATVAACTTVAASTIVKSTNSFKLANLNDGMTASGSGIPSGTTVTHVGTHSLTLSQAATASASGLTLTFDQPYVPPTIPSAQSQPTPMAATLQSTPT